VLPYFALPPEVFIDVDALPDLAVKSSKATGVVVRLGHQDDRVVADVDQEAVATLDLEPPARFVRDGDQKIVRDLHS
jgi:hypothetical protein